MRTSGVGGVEGPSDLIDLVGRLSSPDGRPEAARALAAALEVETLLLFVADPVLAAPLPAPGFLQTLRGGPAWRSFLSRCTAPGRYTGTVDLPAASARDAFAIASDGIALILIGGTPCASALGVVERLLPLLAAVLRAEQRALLASAQALEAEQTAQRAHALASALEAARAEGWKLNAELRGEHQRKDDFLAMLAHELRNPLAPLVNTLELMRRRGGQGSGDLAPLDVMARQVRQLSRLVEDLLDVSRVRHGRIGLRRRRCLVGDIIADAVEASQSLLDARRHRITVDLSPELLVIDADPVRLTQIFSNLLHNAAKYTDPGGCIEIATTREGTDALIRISDNGVGIPAEVLPRIFELFVQAPVALGRAQGGLGIGLTLVRSLVELHGGRITAESEGSGRGSTFNVHLPLAIGEACAAEPDIVATEAAGARALQVLVVDDNVDMADSLAELLRFMGNHAEVAYTGLEALQRAADLDPDLILLDIGLPELDGYEVGRRLRRIVRQDTYLVALTGYGSDEDRRRSRAAEFDEHVVKPVSPEALEAIAERAGRASPT